LLLFVRTAGEKGRLDRFLCGHDEREWFVAAVPGRASSVRQAMEVLQPSLVHRALADTWVPVRQRYARKNRAFRRQGEWFFVPAASLTVEPYLVLKDEPLRRGAGEPHLVEELYRTGGETVHVCRQHPNGLTSEDYKRLLRRTPRAASWGWRVMKRNPEVYVRGAVRHPDHATIYLPVWHRVALNTETQSQTMTRVAFLD